MAPRIRIPAHVAGYSLALIPGIAYAYYWKENHLSDEDLEEKLKENYASKIQGSKEKKQDMVKFFEAMKNQNDPDQEQKMQQVLYGGKGDIKRHYAVDEKLYGTEEGAKLAEEAKKQKEVPAKKKKKRKKQRTSSDSNDEQAREQSVSDRSTTKHVATGILALGVLGGLSFIIGGRKSQ